VRLDEGEFGVFLLTNPRQRLDTGRRLAGVETRLQKSQNNSRFSLIPASIWRMSAEQYPRLASSPAMPSPAGNARLNHQDPDNFPRLMAPGGMPSLNVTNIPAMPAG
jgi:hypothetical protein